MLKPTSLTHISSFLLSHSGAMSSARFGLLCHCHRHFPTLPPPPSSSSSFSFPTPRLFSTPYPLQYELIINRPSQPHTPRPPPVRHIDSPSQTEPDEPDSQAQPELDKAQRKYYNKRRKRMYGSDSDEDSNASRHDDFVELKPHVVEFPTLHKREEELYFYDAFTYPWEKEKHYKMVYQLEKKYFPDQCLDKAFLQPGQSNANANANVNTNANSKDKGKGGRKKVGVGGDEKLVFFEGKEKGEEDGSGSRDLTEKKVEEFFKGLKKVPNNNKDVQLGDPFLSSGRTGLPPVWDSPHGTVLLVNKPKGWTSFTVCGKLRRLVKVKKVGHAGTLDPMATGLLIVCVGKATKLVDRYQGMIKGYSGVFRLGEATSTWDADSPVIQREPWEHIKDEDIKRNALSLCGEIWQVPPMFSAIKVGGEKMYEKARRGESIELSPRRISIFQFDIERSLDDRQNLIFRVTCSKGTYIRSLCADFGKALGSCAHLTALRRDSIGQYSADDAWDFQELEEAITKNFL
ncbi:tRNA pseudouridine synthase B [Spatholobus suberectus]|nr:tRNA pseudouridine synthase B [Spatholobus suberectus]